jgi:hypothetical protein
MNRNPIALISNDLRIFGFMVPMRVQSWRSVLPMRPESNRFGFCSAPPHHPTALRKIAVILAHPVAKLGSPGEALLMNF